MLPSELKLTSLGHCYVHLSETFVSSEPAIKGGSIVCIKSLQTENQLLVMWNGQLTSSEHVQLDLTFAQANNLKDELVIISLVDKIDLAECSSCRVELLDSADHSILSQHTDINLLDTCRLITVGLVVPIFLSQHVKVLVKVVAFEPNQPFGQLTSWTEMNFEHNSLSGLPKSPRKDGQDQSISNPIEFLSCSLGIDYDPKFHLGSILVCGERGVGKTYFIKKVLEDYKRFHSEILKCKHLRGKRPETVKKEFSELLARALEKQPSIIALDDVDSILACESNHNEDRGQEALYKKRLVHIFCHLIKQLERQTSGVVVVIASCRSLESLDEKIAKSKGRGYFNEIIRIEPPNLAVRVEILRNIMREQNCSTSLSDQDLEMVAQRCNSFMPSDLIRVFERALMNACSARSLNFDSNPVSLELSDFLDSIDGYTPINLRAISLQPKTKRTLQSVGGMKHIKETLLKTVLLPIKYPKLYRKCPLKLQNSILLFGPPGCGKTLLAEALANEESINSICVRGPELLSKYIGASEAAVRDLFKRAQLARPCLVFFDEFESLVAKRGADSTGVTDRVVNQFLTILDGVESLSHDIFIVAATSRPDMIDPAMLRPGRLDRHIFCPLPNHEDRREILEVLSRNMDLVEGIDLSKWSVQLERFTGADIQAFLYSAQLKALHDHIGSTAPSASKTLTLDDDDDDDDDDTTENNAQGRPASKQIGIVCDGGGGGGDRSRHGSDQNMVDAIRVHEGHLVAAYNEMRANIDERFASLIKQYPSTIGQTKLSASMRATLA